MKLLKAAIICGTLLTATAHASNYCDTVAKVSTTIMKNRQLGVPLSEMMEIANKPTLKEISGTIKQLTIAAYEQPRYSTPINQERAITDFADKQMLNCLKRTGK